MINPREIKEIEEVLCEFRADVFISFALLGADVGWCFIPNWVAFTSSRFRWRIPLNDMSSSSHATLCHTNTAQAHKPRAHASARAHTHTSLCCFQVLSAYGSNDDYILNEFSYEFSIFVATTRIIRCYNKPTWVFSHYGCYSFWHTGTEQH